MTFSRIASSPVPLTAYTVIPNPEDEQQLRIILSAGSIADLSKRDAMALAEYIRNKFPEEIPA